MEQHLPLSEDIGSLECVEVFKRFTRIWFQTKFLFARRIAEHMPRIIRTTPIWIDSYVGYFGMWKKFRMLESDWFQMIYD